MRGFRVYASVFGVCSSLRYLLVYSHICSKSFYDLAVRRCFVFTATCGFQTVCRVRRGDVYLVLGRFPILFLNRLHLGLYLILLDFGFGLHMVGLYSVWDGGVVA